MTATEAMTGQGDEAANSTLPDIIVSTHQVFGIDSDMEVPAFSQNSEHVPDIDETYRFDKTTTLAILAGFAYNRRVMIQGYHGTGKSTHIEQVAARLNWPCIRINLDSHISRIDLIGKDAIVLRDGTGHDNGAQEEYMRSPLDFGGRHTEALAALDLRPPVTVAAIKVRYKVLVKRHHPDANGGSRKAEERLKTINIAYGTLMQALAD